MYTNVYVSRGCSCEGIIDRYPPIGNAAPAPPPPTPPLPPPRLLPDVGEAPGANMVITASKEKGGKASLGASIAMERLRFPVMMQVTLLV